MSKRKKFGTTKLCIYCGQRPGNTADHVPPKSLYGDVLPQNLITVPCCRPCNQAKQQDDDYLREYLVMEAAGHGHPTAEAIFQGPLLRASQDPYYKRTPLIHAARWTGLLAPRYADNGQYLGDFVQVPLQSERLRRTLARITQALYYDQRQQRLSVEYGVAVSYLPQKDAPTEFRRLWDLGVQQVYCAGEGEVFCCVHGFGVGESDAAKSIWLMEFYQSIYYLAFTAPLADFPELYSVGL